MNMLKQRTYEEFIQEVKERILDFIPENANLEVVITKVRKNNNIVLDGLSIINKDEKFQFSPTIYLNHYYEELEEGRFIVDIIREIAKIHLENNRKDVNLKNMDLHNLDNIYVNVINKEKNKELLKETPYIEFEDLAIVFKNLVSNTTDGISSILITNELFKNEYVPKMDLDALYEKALSNTRRLFDIIVRRMDEVLLEALKNEYNLPEDILQDIVAVSQNSCPMYVITNKKGIFGATAILFNDVFENLSRKFNSDLCILPSSIHELIAIPINHAEDPNDLKSMVNEINGTQVAPDEVLSDNIYIYRRKKRTITLF